MPLGHNKLNTMVKTMTSEAGVESYYIYTNHSLRATTVSRLFQNDVDYKLIKGVTGHRSDALQGYKRETEEQLLKVSKIVQGQCFTQLEHKVIIYGIMTYCSTSVTSIMYGGPWLSRHIQISHGTTKYLTAQPKTLTAQPNISRRKEIDHGGSKFHGGTLACCMSIKAKMAESGNLEDGDLELPEEV